MSDDWNDWSQQWAENDPGYIAATDQVMAEVNGTLRRSKAFVVVALEDEGKALVVGRGQPADEEALGRILYEAAAVRPLMQQAIREGVFHNVDLSAAAKEYEQHLEEQLTDGYHRARAQHRALYMLYAATALNLIAGMFSLWRIFW